MKWEEVDLDMCVHYIRTSEDIGNPEYIETIKSILNKYTNGYDLSVKQKNVIKRFYIAEVLQIDLFDNEVVTRITIDELRNRIKEERKVLLIDSSTQNLPLPESILLRLSIASTGTGDINENC